MLTIDLRGQTALITGASGMLGRVIARVFADCGANLILHYYHGKEQAEALAGELRGRTGRRILTVYADVTDADSVAEMQRRVAGSAVGMPDILVHNAVIQYEQKPLLEQPLADFDSQYGSCVMQTVHMAKAFVPAMIKKAPADALLSSTPNARHSARRAGAPIPPQSAVWTASSACWRRSLGRTASRSIRWRRAGRSRRTTAAITRNRIRTTRRPCRSDAAAQTRKSRRCALFWRLRSRPSRPVRISPFRAAA